VLPDLAVFNAAGQPETVKYHLLPAFLLAGYQAQQNTIAALTEKIETQANEIAGLKQRIASSEGLEDRLRRLEAVLLQRKAASLQQ
jgi:Tfp pilus assembly protein PilN